MDPEELKRIVQEMLTGQLAAALPEALKPLLEEEIKQLMASKNASGALNVDPVAQRLADQRNTFHGLSEFASAVRTACLPGGRVDQRLVPAPPVDGGADGQRQPASWLGSNVDSAVGFLLPTEFLHKLLQKVEDLMPLGPRCFQVPMQSNALEVPYIDEISRVTGSRYGGMRAYKVAEGAQKDPTGFKVGMAQLRLNEAAVLIPVANSTLEDSPISLEALITEIGAKELNWTMDEEIVFGTGAGQALGIMNAACLVTVLKEVAQAATTIVSQNIIKMWSRMYAPSRASSIWLINQDIEPQLFTMVVAVGAGGVPVYMPANGLAERPYATLFGRPVLPSEHCQTLGTTGDIIFADMSQYLLGHKAAGIDAQTSIHLWFDYNLTAFRLTLRWDGQPWWRSTLTPAKGTNTLSPFVALETRA